MVHNCAARLILGRRKYEHVTPMLVELHWLPVKERIVYKICLFVFKCLNHSAPQYLQDLVIPILSSQVVSLPLQSVIQEVGNFCAAIDTLIDQDALSHTRIKERSLRSQNKNLIDKYTAMQKRTGERSFAFNAGKYWNLLQKELRLTRKINRFKSDLKTFFF